jgi:hypothetical protein
MDEWFENENFHVSKLFGYFHGLSKASGIRTHLRQVKSLSTCPLFTSPLPNFFSTRDKASGEGYSVSDEEELTGVPGVK